MWITKKAGVMVRRKLYEPARHIQRTRSLHDANPVPAFSKRRRLEHLQRPDRCAARLHLFGRGEGNRARIRAEAASRTKFEKESRMKTFNGAEIVNDNHPQIDWIEIAKEPARAPCELYNGTAVWLARDQLAVDVSYCATHWKP